MTPHIKDYTGTAGWVALEDATRVFSGTLTAKSTNGSALDIRVNASATLVSTMVAGEYDPYTGVDLSQIQIRGNGLVLQARGTLSGGFN